MCRRHITRKTGRSGIGPSRQKRAWFNTRPNFRIRAHKLAFYYGVAQMLLGSRWIRFCVALFLGALVSGCSTGPKLPGIGPKATTGIQASDRIDECKGNRSGCKYEGAYEPKERAYAEQEAKRLNRAALERFRRGADK